MQEKESLNERRKLARLQRGAGRPPKWWLRKLRKATYRDARELVFKCVEAILNDNKRNAKVVVKFPFNIRKTAKDLPRFIVLDEEGYTITVKMSADMVLDYLQSKGYCSFTASELRKSALSFDNKLIRFNALAEYALKSECVRYLEESL